MSLNRKDFLRTIGAVGATLAVGNNLKASPDEKKDGKDPVEFSGILVDTTLCVGCHTCEYTCAEEHGLPTPNEEDFLKPRTTSPDHWTVVNEYTVDDQVITVKKQCMHCNQPGCATGCLTKAMKKTEQGPVIWRENKCMGCRFCMVNCPFEIPKFEFNSPNPKVQKCIMCYDRVQEGKVPACVETCPAEAIIFGKRRELLEIAKKRIYENPDSYVHHIYGENEVGGTGVMYLASVPFEKLGFNTNLGSTSLPEYSKGFLYSVPIIFTAVPALLLGMHSAASNKENKSIEKEESYE